MYGGVNPVTDQPRYFIKNFDLGRLGGFTTVDISTGWRFSKIVNINGSVSNLFDTEQNKFVASPSIGRLYAIELRINI